MKRKLNISRDVESRRTIENRTTPEIAPAVNQEKELIPEPVNDEPKKEKPDAAPNPAGKQPATTQRKKGRETEGDL